MSYPTGPAGFGAQQPNPQQYPGQPAGYPAAAPAAPGRGLPFILNMTVLGLGILTFFLGFAPYAAHNEGGMFGGDDKDSMNFFANMGVGVGVLGLALLLTAALVAGFGLLPKQPDNAPVVAALSLAGFLVLLFLMFGIVDGLDSGTGLILALVTSFVQAACAIGAVLASSGIIKPPAPRQYAPYPQGGYPLAAPPQGGYGGPVAGPTQQMPTGYPQPNPNDPR